MKNIFIILCCSFLSTVCIATTNNYAFRVYLKDKGLSDYTVQKPQDFLSDEAIARRERFNIPITTEDLPISDQYAETFKQKGFKTITKSKWFSTIVVAADDSSRINELVALPMVDSVKFVWKGCRDTIETSEASLLRQQTRDAIPNSIYGYAERQIKMLQGDKLHKSGYKGKGMRVAVIDAGFDAVDKIPAFDSTIIVDTHNVLNPGETVYSDDDHGTKVLACLAANNPGMMVGTAPEASYYLIKSEDCDTEYPIEEDYWTAAVEYADSIGVDVISSSLGYFTFDDDSLSYSISDLDGKTSMISQAADCVAAKGILVFCSAGNEGNSDWEQITFPADAAGICTVGAVSEDKKRSIFSSKGYTADGRIKPDLVALGSGCCVLDTSGNISYANGTSFATPILAGTAICLWQALPWLSNKELITLLQQNASKATRPDPELGYGLPDVYKAYKKGKKYASKSNKYN